MAVLGSWSWCSISSREIVFRVRAGCWHQALKGNPTVSVSYVACTSSSSSSSRELITAGCWHQTSETNFKPVSVPSCGVQPDFRSLQH